MGITLREHRYITRTCESRHEHPQSINFLVLTTPILRKREFLSHPLFIIIAMSAVQVEQAVELLEKANADLEPELLPAPLARRLLAVYARAEKLAAYGVAALARKLDDASELARVTGTPLGKAKAVVATGKVLGASGALSDALQQGDISLDQAAEIASAEESSPGAAKELVPVAQKEPFHVLRDKARNTRLEAAQHQGLAERQRAVRAARSHLDELGMTHIHLAFEPHVGTPIVARAEAEACRLARAAHQGRHQGAVRGPSRRRLCGAAVGLGQGPRSASRARGAGQL